MNPFLLIGLTLGVGLALQFTRCAGELTASRLNAFVIYIALPALILLETPRLTFDSTLILPVLVAWLVMLVTSLAVLILGVALRWPKPILGCLLLILPLGNTGFVGIPLIDALVGKEGIGYAILYDQFGTFLALNTYGIAIAVGFSGGHSSLSLILGRIVRFPPFICLWVALAIALSGWSYPPWLQTSLAYLAWSLVPVVMVAVGISWHLKLAASDLKVFIGALIALLIFKPLLALGATWVLGEDGLVQLVVVLEAGMPAMISAGVLAMRYQLAPKLAASLMGYSLLFAIPSLLFWRWLLV
ncbi:AEC family transporter [Gilvimarinus agarilyticus]|uniref:AEC family transporter n=1 Tax=unclassified Gilvimarinus TaxID=2642066 RepID=UPI001C0A317A|nr:MULTISPECIES: AEC family transporter [unclassified Gilvimarinus]MBU2887299.1 AEC family transporter [Gilvimarinus agarilyticus]MDO6571958.1 AEC family transporter [Gilvimarinus sp. 2_MG-2023]MDO6746026.1 AEC family transporter [Gilvimarinus sp. 1_MG-2023]